MMISTKKLQIALAVCVLFALSSGLVFAEGKIVLEHWGIQYFYGDLGPWMEKKIQEYEAEHPNIKINLTAIPYENYFEKLLAAFAGGVGPDVFEVPPNVLQTYYEQDILLDLTPYVPEDIVNDIAGNVLAGASRQGKLYGLPYELEPIGLYYRKDLLQEAGVSIPPKIETWDDLVEVATKLTKPGQYGLGIYNEPDPHFLMYILSFIWQGGGEIVDDPFNPTKATCNTPEVASALQMMGDLFNKYNAAPLKQLEDPLINGQIAMQMTGIWNLNQFKRIDPDMDFGVIPLPRGPKGDGGTVGGGWTLAGNSKTKYPEEVAEHIVWLRGNPDFVLDWTLTEGSMPARKSLQDKWLAGLSDDSRERAKAFSAMLPYLRLEQPYPPELVDAVIEMGQNVIFGGMSGAEAAKVGAEAIDRYFKTR